MPSRSRSSIVPLFATAFAVGAQLQSPADAAPPTATAAVPRINFQTRTLANGLTVYYYERHNSPTVSIQVCYKVGSKDDPPGRSGFAHLFEHIMFKSTKNMKAETMDRLTEDVGGDNNAYTEEDATVYYETIPSNYLETLLWAEADRMANLKVDEANFRSERLVVEEEYRNDVLARPYGRLYDALEDNLSYTKPAFSRPTIGSISDLDTATLADVLKFHEAYYRPDNAVLVVVGDFNPAQMNRYIDKYFGRIAQPSTPISRADGTEPERTALQSFQKTAPSVPLPAVMETYLTPGVADADVPALRVADIILSGGESTRLHHSLVYNQRVASQVSASDNFHAQVGLISAVAIASSGTPLEKVRKSLLAEIDGLKAAPPTLAELTLARNQLLTGDLSSRETNEGLAAAIANAVVIQGDADAVNTETAKLSSVTAADVQRVVSKYFTDTNRVEILYTSGPDSLGLKASVAGAVHELPSIVGASKIASVTGAVEKPPLPSAPRSARFPKPVTRKLANGLEVIVIPHPGTGLVTANIVFKTGGSASEPDNRAGLAKFTAGLLTRGTTTRSATIVAATAESLGTSIGANAGWDTASAGLTVLRQNLTPAIDLLADVVENPAFAAEEITRLRAESLDDLQVSLQEPRTIAQLAAQRAVFGTEPYGHPDEGTARTIGALSRADARAFHAKYYVPANAVLVFGGDITPEAAYALAASHFGGWKAGAGTPLKPTAKSGWSEGGVMGRLIVIDKPDAGQAAVVVSRRSIANGDPRHYTADVANVVLGGGYSSRLNLEIRIKRGLSYGAGSSIDQRRIVGAFTARVQTKNVSAGEVADLVLVEIRRLATETVSPAELTPRVASLAGGYARRLETGRGLVDRVSSLAAFDLPLSDLTDYLPRIESVTPAAIRRFAAENLSPAEADIIVVGNASEFLPDLRRRVKLPTMVIPAKKLDFDAPLPIAH